MKSVLFCALKDIFLPSQLPILRLGRILEYVCDLGLQLTGHSAISKVRQRPRQSFDQIELSPVLKEHLLEGRYLYRLHYYRMIIS